jgi:hypothetical protein
MSSYIRQGRQFWLPAVAGSVRERNTRTHLWLTMTITESAMRTQRAGPVRAASRR